MMTQVVFFFIYRSLKCERSKLKNSKKTKTKKKLVVFKKVSQNTCRVFGTDESNRFYPIVFFTISYASVFLLVVAALCLDLVTTNNY